MTRRQKQSCVKGKRANRTSLRTEIGEDTELLEFSYSKESKEKIEFKN